MLFAIYSVDHTGKEYYHEYNNLNQEITATLDRVPTYLKYDPRFQHLIDSKNKKTPLRKNHFYNIRIQLGMACNYSCKYCHQHNDRELYSKIQNCEEIVNRIVTKLVDQEVVCDNFTFWGGEPLLYWNVLRKLSTRLRELYPKCGLSLCTNGSLLTIDKAKFLKDNGFKISLSHDGPSFSKNRCEKDPLDKPSVVNALRYFYDPKQKNLAINLVLTPDNVNLDEVYQYIQAKTGLDIPINIESIVRTDASMKDGLLFDTEPLRNSLYKSVFNKSIHVDYRFGRLYGDSDKLVTKIVDNLDIVKNPYSCNVATSSYLALDLYGNVLACHDANAKSHTIGNIDDITNIEREKYLTKCTSRDKCLKCPYVISCRGGCPRVVEGADHATACKNLQIYHGILFAAAWYKLFGTFITKIVRK